MAASKRKSTILPWGVRPASLKPVPGAPGKLSGVITVTPEMARHWLSDPDRPPNRGISNNSSALIRGWIRRGEWKVTHQGFAFDVAGKLFDGAHRCHAIAAEGTPVQVTIAVGFDYESVMPALDGGKKRTLGEILRIKGKPHATQLATALRWVYLPLGGPQRIRSNRVPSPFEALRVLDAYPSVEAWVHRASSARGFRKVCPSVGQFAGLCTLLSEVDKDGAEEFFVGVATGAELRSGDPRLLLRDRFLRSKQAKTGMPDKLYPTQVYTYTVTSWRLFCQGQYLSKLYRPKYGEVPPLYGFDWEKKGALPK